MADFADQIQEAFPQLTSRPGSCDHPAFNLGLAEVVPICKALRDEWGFQMLIDHTAIDRGVDESPRYEVVLHLFDPEAHRYLRLAAMAEGDLEPTFPTLVPVWPAADWHERECYDMFGITFEGHPDLRRILMWDGYPHFPLRKDFPLAGREVELPAEDVADETGVTVLPAPMMGGPFRADARKRHMSDAEPRAQDESWTETSQPSLSSDEDPNYTGEGRIEPTRKLPENYS